MNWYKHHLGDWDGATAHLTWLEHTAYIKLIHCYYRNEKPIRHEARYRIVRAMNKMQRAAVDRILHEFFQKKNDIWSNKRCNQEIAAYKAQARINKRIANEAWTKRRTKPLPSQIPDTKIPDTRKDLTGPQALKELKRQRRLGKKMPEKQEQSYEETERMRAIAQAMAEGDRAKAERIRNDN